MAKNKIIEVSEEELKKGCKKKVYIDGEFVEVVIPKDSKDQSRIAVEVEDKNGKKKKYIFLLCLLATPIITKGNDMPNEDVGMKPRKKGMKYHSPKKGKVPKGLIVGGGLTAVIIAVLVIMKFLPSKSIEEEPKEEKKVAEKKPQKVICDYYFNEDFASKWIPSQHIYYEFLFDKNGNKIESISITQKFKYNQGSQAERAVCNGNVCSYIPGGTDDEIKNEYYDYCDSCSVEDGLMTNVIEISTEEFLESSNLRDDKSKTLQENLVDTFNIASSCEEGYFPFIPYIDTQADICPLENFKANCTVKDAD